MVSGKKYSNDHAKAFKAGKFPVKADLLVYGKIMSAGTPESSIFNSVIFFYTCRKDKSW